MIEMKKNTFVALAMFICGAPVFAQENIEGQSIRTETVYSTDKYKVETNRFWSNWFIGVGGGTQLYFGDHNKQMDFKDRLSPTFNAFVGKWFTPGIGVRAVYNGRTVKGATQNGSFSIGKDVPGKGGYGYWLEQQEFDYAHFHTDVLFNLSNIFFGYNEKRFWNLSVYSGIGMMLHEGHPRNEEVALSIGVSNTFRLSRALDMNLDIMGAMVNDRFDGELGNRKQEGPLSVTLGLAYKFKQRKWSKSKSTTIYNENESKLLMDKLNEALSQNQRLQTSLKNSKGRTIEKTIVKSVVAANYVAFQINSTELSKEARVTLGMFAGAIKNTSEVYIITGYADKATGTPDINERLSKDRAQAVYDCLVNEFGISESRLKLDYKGGIGNMFYDSPELSRAVITKVKQD
jgi:Outer membrane protein and related peptidoglycan-associated (lipo)proteins